MQVVFQVCGHCAACRSSTSADDERTKCLRYRSAGTGTLPDTDLTNDRCPRRKDGAPTEWCEDG
ncbi:hypothetical protein PI125_g19263 [Phytophthora idaei]|nr:hypothetical protein PI125_g19263 [Phytophthora idaei]KAG3140605.1 hypothetical protein PI126_g15920 [Phytophthora idaei]